MHHLNCEGAEPEPDNSATTVESWECGWIICLQMDEMILIMIMMNEKIVKVILLYFPVNTWIKRPSPKPDTARSDDGQEGKKVGGGRSW